MRESSFPLSHLGISWVGSAARIRVRTGDGWGRWRHLDGCGGGPDGKRRPGRSTLLVAPGGIGYEVAVAGSGAGSVTELNTLDGPTAQAAAASAASGMPLPAGVRCNVTYLSRSAWGADESLRFDSTGEVWPAEYYPVQVFTFHHTAGANSDPNPAATVRAIYYYQAVTQGWGDIGYHLMIDEAGRVYEGRWSGSDAAPVFGPAGVDGRPQMSVGAHAYTYNTGNIGVCLLGNFMTQKPTLAARTSLMRVLGSLARVGVIFPLSTVAYRNPVNGGTKTVAAICGHRNWAATDCPGDLAYPLLPEIRLGAKRYYDLAVPITSVPQRPSVP